MRYFRLLATFYKNALLSELEYRTNFVVNVLMSVFWLFWSLIGLQVYFNHTSQIGGWSYDEAMIVVGLFQLANGYMQAFLQPNISEIGNHIRNGTMDFILTKPVNSQFLASTRTVVLWRLLDIVMGLVIVVYALWHMGASVSPGAVALFVLMLAAAAVILYALWLMLVTTAFWLVRVDNISELIYAFYEAARYPVSVYRGALQMFLTFIIPIAFITTIPAAALVSRLDAGSALYGIAMAIALFFASAAFWRFALRFYASASS
ncbi:MAG: ABC-2 family transporter protein [Chloroflexi bacterium]|nr:ABC-2 family transporter protein [Chloroflexota bacterium]